MTPHPVAALLAGVVDGKCIGRLLIVRAAPKGQRRSSQVTLPEGRVFFSCACWESRQVLPNDIIGGAIDMPNGQRAGVVEGPGDVYVLDQGGCSVKRNDFRNLWGSLGDVMLILGRFSVAALVPEARADETPQERAARERAEDAVRGRSF